MKFIKSIYITALLTLLYGCSTTISVYNPLDPTIKTVSVPFGNQKLLKTIKKELANNGWELFVYNKEATITQGKSGETTDLKQFNLFKTKYVCEINWRYSDNGHLCADVSLIDNILGKEIMAISTFNHNEKYVAEKFIEILNEINTPQKFQQYKSKHKND